MAQTVRSQRTRSVTMRDVAKAAKVSQSTVSRVLNGANGGIPISDDTKQRVLEAVEQLGYYPNLYAGSLRGLKTQMLAMMVADIANPFYHPMVRAVQDAARARGYDVMLSNTDHMREAELYFCNSIIRRQVDGVILAPYHLTAVDIERLIDRTGVAVAAVGQHVDHSQVDVVFGSDDVATSKTTAWLINDKKHTRIGFIGVTDKFAAGFRRRCAFQAALAEAKLEMPPEYFQEGDWSFDSGLAAMATLLSLPSPPTAVFVLNDLMAIGAIEAVRQRGLHIPKDIAIVGFDDIPASSWVFPKLTTVAQYPDEMGRVLATAVFERLDGFDGAGRRYEVPCRLVERHTT
jgi:LacI family transcriptional regulator